MHSSSTIYVITYHAFNHDQIRLGKKWPLDPRFLESGRNYVYYLIDQKVPEPLLEKKTLLEHQIDPVLHEAGGKYFGEWSFLLAEEKHAFCQYPFFMISSRFYEKNAWLLTDLNREWEALFSHLGEYGFGYLPSYNRPLRWIDLAKVSSKREKYRFSPFTEKTYETTKNLFGVRIPEDYRFTADLFCNYIGFNSRKDLLSYVEFYRPLLDFFFDASYQPKKDLAPYIRSTGMFRNEKPFTFFLELLCHLYFFQNKKPYFALHYDGYYALDEAKKKREKLSSFSLPLSLRCKRFCEWQWRKSNTEGMLGQWRAKLRTYPLLHKSCQAVRSLLASKNCLKVE